MRGIKVNNSKQNLYNLFRSLIISLGFKKSSKHGKVYNDDKKSKGPSGKSPGNNDGSNGSTRDDISDSNNLDSLTKTELMKLQKSGKISNHEYMKHLAKFNKDDKPKKSLDDIISEEVEKRVEELADDNDAYDDFLDEVLTMEKLIEDYSYSRILKETDDVMYRTGHNDYVDSLMQDEERELEQKAEAELEDEKDGKEYTQKELSDRTDKLTKEREEELMNDTEMYDNTLDDSGADGSDLGGSTASVLKEIDPTAYRVGMSDWADGERDRIEDEVRDEIDEDESLSKGKYEE